LTTPTPSDNYNFTAVFWIAASAEDNRTGIDEATNSAGCYSFSMNDAQVLKPFGLFREEDHGVSHIGMGQLKSWVGNLLESK
jgi:hypothetical protein